jgi:hypothetical protein
VAIDIPPVEQRYPQQAPGAHWGSPSLPSETPEKPKVEPPEGSLPYGLLCQKHDEYDAELIEKIDDLYRGGFEIQKKASKYLCRLEGESAVKFTERCRIVTYIAFFSQIIGQFTSDVFGQPLSIKPAGDADNPNTPGELPNKDFYPELEKNVDRRGTSFVDLMTCTLRTALKHRRALVIIDAPDAKGAPDPVSLADEDANGSRRLYAYETPLQRLIDWKLDDDTGRFVWAILYDREQTRETPLTRRDRIKEIFTIWTIGTEKDATAEWVRYSYSYKSDETVGPETYFSVEDRGTTSFKRIPILRFELPEGLWVGNIVGPQALEHWQRRSALIGAENRSLVAIPYVKRGPQAPAAGGSIPADISGDQQRGNRPVQTFNSKGYLELDAEDDVGFAEPEGKCYELVDKQLEKLREMMFQVTFQMASSVQRNNTSMGRSGVSKQKDEDLTGRVLRALGHAVREFGVEVFDTISQARKEDVHWAPHGLDGYDSEDREQVLEEAMSLDQIAEAIPSETFHMTHARAIAEKLLKGAVDVETMATIIDELQEGIKAKHAILDLKQDAEKDAIENPPAPTVPAIPTPGVPPVKTPKVPAVKQPDAGAGG